MHPLNTQPVSKPDLAPDGALDVFRVWETLQGEGPFSGTPSVFVRLSGCNMRCPKCDTDYTSYSSRVSPEELLRVVQSFPTGSRKGGIVTITGGEPFRQNIGEFARLCFAHDLSVHVETNGTMFPPECWVLPLFIVCSPKAATVDQAMRSHVKVLKYVLKAEDVDPSDGLPKSVLGYDHPPARPWPGFKGLVIVQPMDEGDPALNKANEQAAIRSAMKFGYRFQIQLHKLVGLE